MAEDLLSVRIALMAHCRVAAPCLKCDHIHDLDLKALAKRHADTPRIRLPLRCRIVVSGREPG